MISVHSQWDVPSQHQIIGTTEVRIIYAITLHTGESVWDKVEDSKRISEIIDFRYAQLSLFFYFDLYCCFVLFVEVFLFCLLRLFCFVLFCFLSFVLFGGGICGEGDGCIFILTPLPLDKMATHHLGIRRHFQLHFLKWKWQNSDSYFTEICSQGSNWQLASFGSGNGLTPNRRQAITRTSDGPVHWWTSAGAPVAKYFLNSCATQLPI